ncbi:MAG: hypothetical protein ABH839_00005 [Chloroflexota bacterium]
MIEKIRNDLKAIYPPDICDALIDSYIEIKEQYYLNKLEPSELNGGKFVEACARLIQQELTGSYVPINEHIPNMAKVLRDFENSDKTKKDSFRIHIPRLLLSVYTIRNKRGVGHLGGDVNSNLSDATVLAAASDWVLAELYRIIYTVSLDEAQGIVNNLVRRKMPIVCEIKDVRRVLDPRISYRDQTLILLYSVYPNVMTDEELVNCLEYGNPSRYRSNLLINLHKDRLIEYSKDFSCTILPPGIVYVEQQYNQWLINLNKGV